MMVMKFYGKVEVSVDRAVANMEEFLHANRYLNEYTVKKQKKDQGKSRALVVQFRYNIDRIQI